MNYEKYPVYFVMLDESPDGGSFLRMAREVFNRGFDEYRFQKTMIMTEEQKVSFLGWMANNITLPSDENASLWEFAGFRIKTLRGKLE